MIDTRSIELTRNLKIESVKLTPPVRTPPIKIRCMIRTSRRFVGRATESAKAALSASLPMRAGLTARLWTVCVIVSSRNFPKFTFSICAAMTLKIISRLLQTKNLTRRLKVFSSSIHAALKRNATLGFTIFHVMNLKKIFKRRLSTTTRTRNLKLTQKNKKLYSQRK